MVCVWPPRPPPWPNPRKGRDQILPSGNLDFKNDPSPLSYTWRHPCGSKRLVWAISGYMEEYFNELKSDDFKIIQLEEDKLVGWVSFLDGMQRILLFTEDVNLCYKVSVFAAIKSVLLISHTHVLHSQLRC